MPVRSYPFDDGSERSPTLSPGVAVAHGSVERSSEFETSL
jgi:hypothetical protein